jgi:prepilin-type N-terminal cleavage/methylation domain-containing protein
MNPQARVGEAHPPAGVRSDNRAETMAGKERRGFSLLELLVVMAIIGMMAALGLPALKGLGQSNAMSAAARQLLDDFAFARLKAINTRTTVYVVFVSPDFFRLPSFQNGYRNLTVAQQTVVSNLINGQYTSYAVVANRTVGDQPGRPTPRYLTEWKSLPDGIFIATNKYIAVTPNDWARISDATIRPFPSLLSPGIPFPTSRSPIRLSLPYIAFDAHGQLYREGTTTLNNADEYVPLARGSVFYPRDAQGRALFDAADVRENPPGNATNMFHRIAINWLTGRPRLEKKEIQ